LLIPILQRFAKHMEEERIRQRMMAGDRWVTERMQKVTDLEDLAEVHRAQGNSLRALCAEACGASLCRR